MGRASPPIVLPHPNGSSMRFLFFWLAGMVRGAGVKGGTAAVDVLCDGVWPVINV
jgi:hypothetical protein